MMREIEKLFETLIDEFNQRMSNVSYFTNANDSIERHVANAGGSITDSYEDISIDENDFQDNSSSIADSNIKSNKLGSIDSEPESMAHVDDVYIDGNNSLDDQMCRRKSQSVSITDCHRDSALTSIGDENFKLDNLSDVKPDTETDIITEIRENKSASFNFPSDEANIVLDDPFVTDDNLEKVVGSNTQWNSIPFAVEDADIVENIKSIIEKKEALEFNYFQQTFEEVEIITKLDTIKQVSEVEHKGSRDVVHTEEILLQEPKLSERIIDEIGDGFNGYHSNNQIETELKGDINEPKVDNVMTDNNVDTSNNELIEASVGECGENVEINSTDKVDGYVRKKPNQLKQTDYERVRKISNERTSIRKSVRHICGSRRMWSEMNEVTESGILDNISKKEVQLQEAMFEIITSEDSYYKSLIVLTSHFFQSDLFNISEDRECFVTQVDKHHIFSNVIYILKASQNFLKDLEQRWHEEKPILYDICDIVFKHAVSDGFQHYVTYLRNQQYQTKALKRLVENESFKQQLYKLESSPKCGKLALDSFLMLPMQRLTRLKLLVEAISKLQCSEELTDKVKVSSKMIAKSALEELKKLLNTSNTEKGLMDQKGALLSLINKIDFPHNIKRITFSDRVLLREEEFRVHHQTPVKLIRKFSKKKQPSLTLLVFNDLLIITKKKGPRLLVIDYCSKDYVDAKSFIGDQDISSNDGSSNTSAIDINNEPPISPLRTIGPTLLRSRTSITDNEKKRLSIPLNNSFISMPSINKIDEHETKTQTFSLSFSESHSNMFTSPIFLTARNKEEYDLWMSIFNKDQFQNNSEVFNKSNPSKLQKSLSLKINSNYTEKSNTKKNHFLKKRNDITDDILSKSEIAQDWNDEFLMNKFNFQIRFD